jgi:NAD-dependent deacetylase
VSVAKRKPKLVVLTGAGMSAESGLKTFRDSGGLWEGYDVRDVATPEAWHRNPSLVLQFYNERRRALLKASPNEGHLGLAEIEHGFDVQIITQNVDDLHERAGSTSILHLHGLLTRSRSSVDVQRTYPISGPDLREGERCELGSQLRPDIVWFGEEVPLMSQAIELVRHAELFVVIGTSLSVYPAASLIDYVPSRAQCFLIDISTPEKIDAERFTVIKKGTAQGVRELLALLMPRQTKANTVANPITPKAKGKAPEFVQ